MTADLRKALEAIKQATIDGRVCDDVAWFDTITTLHDFCDQVLAAAPPSRPVTAGREITEAMCEVALEAYKVDRIQGFSYEKRHVIRDVWQPPEKQEIWSAPVAGPDEYQAFQRQCRIERMRVALAAALALTPQDGRVGLDIRSISQSIKDGRCLEVWFARNVTTEDRAALLRAVNATPPAPGAERAAVIRECIAIAGCYSPADWTPGGMRSGIIEALRALAPKGAAAEREVFRCNCPHEVRAGCSEPKCPHYAVPRAQRGVE